MGTNFKNGVYSFGIPVIGGSIPATKGRYFFVDYTEGNDTNDGKTINTPLKTIAQAYSLARTNKDDVIILMGNASHVLTAMLDMSKNRVHIIGMDGFGGRLYGQNAKVEMGITTATTDVFAVKNTGIRNTFTNVKFINNNTLDQNIGCFGEGGEYTVFNNVEIYDSTRLDSDTHADLVLNSDSPQFFGCTIGSLADVISGDKVRPGILMTRGLVTGAQSSGGRSYDVFFDSCRFWKNAGGTTTSFVKLVDADLTRMMEFHSCQFVAAKLGSTPAVAINSATLTQSQILLTGDTVAFNCTALATATGVISGLTTKTAAAHIGIQATN